MTKNSLKKYAIAAGIGAGLLIETLLPGCGFNVQYIDKDDNPVNIGTSPSDQRKIKPDGTIIENNARSTTIITRDRRYYIESPYIYGNTLNGRVY